MANSATSTILALGLALLCAAGQAQAGQQNMSDVVTEKFFDGIKSLAPKGCEGKDFYTPSAFMEAAKLYPGFARGLSEPGANKRSVVEAKRETAAFFAYVAQATGYLCNVNEINGTTRNYCDSSNKEWPCVPGKMYYGRGPMQISGNKNYGPAGMSLGFDGLGNPDMVAQDAGTAFKTAIWYWMNYVHQVMPEGFGATMKAMAINGGLECKSKNAAALKALISCYKKYSKQFGVNPGSKLTCSS